MTCFEKFFDSLKKALGKEDLFDVWPDFTPEYDEKNLLGQRCGVSVRFCF